MAENRYRQLLEHDVDLRKVRDVEMWTDALDIYTADLFHAVSMVGTSATAVLEYIIGNGLVGSRFRTPDPKPRAPAGKLPGGGDGSS